MIDLENITGVKFCHYTSLENARKILNNGELRLGRFSRMNDISEADMHKEKDGMLFSTCFCHSESKSIPMFYLYSGIDGKGCRIEFTKSKIKELIKNIHVYPVNKKGYRLKKELDKSLYSVHFNWIYYSSHSGFVSYRNEESKQYNSLSELLKEFENDYDKNYFVKNLIWKYEKEFRIVIRIIEPIEYDYISIKIPIKEREKGISLTCGPEISNREVMDISEEFVEYGIQTVHSFADENIKIQMGLVERNRKLLM